MMKTAKFLLLSGIFLVGILTADLVRQVKNELIILNSNTEILDLSLEIIESHIEEFRREQK